MKIAVCFYGIPNCANYGHAVMRKFYEGCEVDYFIHAWGDTETEESLRKLFSPRKIIVEPQRDWSSYLEVVPDMSKTTRGISHSISPLFSIKKVGELLETDLQKYDFAALTRMDIANVAEVPLITKIQPNIVYTSYVNGEMWKLRRDDPNHDNHIDIKFICGSRNSIIYATKLFDMLNTYLGEHNKPLCHHRLFYHHLKNISEPIQMLNMDESDISGGWRMIRNNTISLY